MCTNRFESGVVIFFPNYSVNEKSSKVIPKEKKQPRVHRWKATLLDYWVNFWFCAKTFVVRFILPAKHACHNPIILKGLYTRGHDINLKISNNEL